MSPQFIACVALNALKLNLYDVCFCDFIDMFTCIVTISKEYTEKVSNLFTNISIWSIFR